MDIPLDNQITVCKNSLFSVNKLIMPCWKDMMPDNATRQL